MRRGTKSRSRGKGRSLTARIKKWLAEHPGDDEYVIAAGLDAGLEDVCRCLDLMVQSGAVQCIADPNSVPFHPGNAL
jgi:hypothetical protein